MDVIILGKIVSGMRERGETEEFFLEEVEKKKRRTGEKRYKEKVNKKVDG
jgi:hypothetical protein